jgi:hypothetical protein
MMAAGSLSRPAVLEILQELIRTPSVNLSLSPDEVHGVLRYVVVVEHASVCAIRANVRNPTDLLPATLRVCRRRHF